ncbi:hypothetical protein GH714_036004 [Hevea brasiliensis]|uniref:Uncharacterized protein n=1 Tax=Hevea brasiliensis TaxID=3981 RepID=A0A6A6L720_HEVBR|nr:hypothetical protein GH714_036004 [Hevea brasiliensis]
MAKAKRSSRINELENQLHGMEFLLQQLEQVEEDEIPSFLKGSGYVSKQEIASSLVKVTQSLRKAKAEPKAEQAEIEEKNDSSTNEKYPLVNIPDNMLTMPFVQFTDHMPCYFEVSFHFVCRTQLKEKRRQLFLKTTSDGRQRTKQKRQEEELEQERKNQLDEEKRLENPELYLEQMRVKYKDLSEKVEQRKRLKTNGNHSNGNNVTGGVGRVQEIDPTFVSKPDVGPSQPAPEMPQFRPLAKEDFQILLGVERFRCPEILFHPNLVGIDQAGLDEMAGV